MASVQWLKQQQQGIKVTIELLKQKYTSVVCFELDASSRDRGLIIVS